MKRVFLYVFLVLLLVACGGGGNEPAANNSATDAGSNSAAEANNADNAAEAEEAEPAAEEEAEPAAAEESADEAGGDEDASAEEEPAAEEETAAEEPADEGEAADVGAGDGEGVYFGIDPETGLEINPDPIPFGVEFIARGEVIGMNLTPQNKPEFVIRSPAGQTYRIATQGLDQIFLLDGSQLKPFEYKLKMEAMATAYFPPDASLSDVLTSPDFMIIALPE